MTILVSTVEPLVVRHPGGEIAVQLDDETWAQFRSVANYRAWREHLNREEAQHESKAWRRYEQSREQHEDEIGAARREREHAADSMRERR